LVTRNGCTKRVRPDVAADLRFSPLNDYVSVAVAVVLLRKAVEAG
jgi:hypothetical protein